MITSRNPEWKEGKDKEGEIWPPEQVIIIKRELRVPDMN
jgi:hypothetical protein